MSPQIEKKAFQIIDKSHLIYHTDTIFRKLNVLKTSDLHYVQQLPFYLKYFIIFVVLCTFKIVLEIHNFNTRVCTNQRNSKVEHELSRKCIWSQIPIVINSTTLLIINKTIPHSIIFLLHYFIMFSLIIFPDSLWWYKRWDQPLVKYWRRPFIYIGA